MIVIYVCACMCAYLHMRVGGCGPLGVTSFTLAFVCVEVYFMCASVCLSMSAPHMCSAHRSEASLGSLRAGVPWLLVAEACPVLSATELSVQSIFLGFEIGFTWTTLVIWLGC